MVIFGVVGKFGAIMAVLPEPIIGGSLVVTLGMVAAIGISSLAYTEMDSPRNMTIFGTSLMLGLMIPNWIQSNPGRIKSGNYFITKVILKVVTDMPNIRH